MRWMMRGRDLLSLRAGVRVAIALGIVVLICMGCGRKLPPLPPGEPDPVEVISIRFDQGAVKAKVRCNVRDAGITLLGKPKGICPSCTDDLQKRDEHIMDEPGVKILEDKSPEAEYMVYRVAFKKSTTFWMTQPFIVRK